MFRRLPGSFSALLFPDQCRLCDRPLRELTAVPVCAACLDTLPPARSPHVCQVCGLPFENAAPLHQVETCGLCRRQAPAFHKARGYGSYDGKLRQLIHLLKYSRMRPLARPLARCMASRLGELGPLDLIIPVPLHGPRKWRRGFNQAEALAREVSRFAGVPWTAGVLRRTRATPPQVGLSHRQRRLNLTGAFAVRRPESVRQRRVLLVDDVMTTGATLDTCARALTAAGARSVAGLTAARAKRRLTDGPGVSSTQPGIGSQEDGQR